VRTTQPREPRRYLASSEAELVRRVVRESELPFEFMLNALRLKGGFDAALFPARTGLDWRAIAAPIDRLVRRGMLRRTPERYRPSALGLRFLNEMLLEFMPERAEMPAPLALSTAVSGTGAGSRRPLFTGSTGAIGE
jgi:coproporphyrinogen III oxidase-like Fe-S oxidoreductase